MKYNIVTNSQINQFIRQNSKYYKVDLGQSITLEDRSGDRVKNINDKFAYVYNHHYRSSILKQGHIGDIVFYTDHLITEDILRFYIDREEFVYEFNQKTMNLLGVDGFLGDILKTSEMSYNEIAGTPSDEDENFQKKSVFEKVLNNPGVVRYEDLQAYFGENYRRNIKN